MGTGSIESMICIKQKIYSYIKVGFDEGEGEEDFVVLFAVAGDEAVHLPNVFRRQADILDDVGVDLARDRRYWRRNNLKDTNKSHKNTQLVNRPKTRGPGPASARIRDADENL